MPELLAKGRKDTQKESLDPASGEKCSVGVENGVAHSDEKPPNHLQEFGPQLKIIKINEQVRELQTEIGKLLLLLFSVLLYCIWSLVCINKRLKQTVCSKYGHMPAI